MKSEQKSIKFRITIVFWLMAILSLFFVKKVSLQANPSPRSHTLDVSFQHDRSSPYIIEQGVTSVLERSLSNISGLSKIESYTTSTSGSLRLEFHKDIDIERVRLEISSLLRQIYDALPEEVSYPTISLGSNFATDRLLLQYAIKSSSEQRSTISIIESDILPNLQQVTGINRIELLGIDQHEIKIELDDEKMSTFSFSVDDLRRQLVRIVENYDLGWVSDEKMALYNLSIEGKSIVDLSDIADLKIKNANGLNVALSQIAKIYDVIPEERSIYRIDGKKSIVLAVYSKPEVNQIKVAREFQSVLKSISAQYEEHMSFKLISDISHHLSVELNKILRRVFTTLALLIIFVLVIYPKRYYIYNILTSFAISVSITLFLFYIFNLELHLYSIAGLTLSFGIILDNFLIMTDHVARGKSKQIFLAILASNLTTIFAFLSIFFFNDEVTENIADFFWVFTISLLTSLVTALFYVPSQDWLKEPTQKISRRTKRLVIKHNLFYGRLIQKISHRRRLTLLALILCFGTPIFLLPNVNIKDKSYANIYNNIMVNSYFGRHIRPIVDIALGGSLRLFYEENNSFTTKPIARTVLTVKMSMPFGYTLEHLDLVAHEYEVFLRSFEQIERFSVNLQDNVQGTITIHFMPEYEQTSFPLTLKNLLVKKAINSGSAYFRIYGVGKGFNRKLGGPTTPNYLKISGYRYEKLRSLSEDIKKRMYTYPRIQNVNVNSYILRAASLEKYFAVNVPNNNKLVAFGINSATLYKDWLARNPNYGQIGSIMLNNIPTRITLASNNVSKNSLWEVNNRLSVVESGSSFKNTDLSELQEREGNMNITRVNQEYILFIEFDYVGRRDLLSSLKNEIITNFTPTLPVGYTIEDEDRQRYDANESLLKMVLLALLMIIIIGLILFNSFKQAILPLILVPPSFICIFLSTSIFDYQFDYGGVTAFLLTCGLSVNAGIFIINEFNYQKTLSPSLDNLQIYIKAYNSKIAPILLTAASSILGLVPFIIYDAGLSFWYALAIGTISGLVGSLVGLYLLLPLFFVKP